MAKLYYDPEYSSFSVQADGEKLGEQIEITAEQALAIAAQQIGVMLSNLTDAMSDVASAVRDTVRED